MTQRYTYSPVFRNSRSLSKRRSNYGSQMQSILTFPHGIQHPARRKVPATFREWVRFGYPHSNACSWITFPHLKGGREDWKWCSRSTRRWVPLVQWYTPRHRRFLIVARRISTGEWFLLPVRLRLWREKRTLWPLFVNVPVAMLSPLLHFRGSTGTKVGLLDRHGQTLTYGIAMGTAWKMISTISNVHRTPNPESSNWQRPHIVGPYESFTERLATAQRRTPCSARIRIRRSTQCRGSLGMWEGR